MNDGKSAKLDEITAIRDENSLFEIYTNSDDFDIKYAIANLITDNSILHEMFSHENDPIIRDIVLMRFSDKILDFDNFNTLDSYKKITYIENCTDNSLLLMAVQNDEDFLVRLAAVQMISDNDLLLKIADEHDDYNTRVSAYKKLNGKSLLNEISGENLNESRIELIKDLNNNNFISDIAINDSSLEVRLFALKHLNRPDFFFKIMKNHLSNLNLNQYIKALSLNRFSDASPDEFNTFNCFEKIAYIETCTDRDPLLSTAIYDENLLVRLAAVHMISDYDFLLKIADEHDDYDTRVAVYKKLNGISIFDEMTEENLEESRRELVKRTGDEKFLEDIVKNEDNIKVKKLALKKLNKPNLFFTVLNNKNQSNLSELMEDITNESQLSKIALTFSSDTAIVENAVNLIANPSCLLNLYRNGCETIQESVMKKLLFGNVFSKEKITDKISIPLRILSVCDDVEDYLAKEEFPLSARLEAVRRINNENALMNVLKSDSHWTYRREAVMRVSDENVLMDVAKHDSEVDVRKAAIKKISGDKIMTDILSNDSACSETSHEVLLEIIARFHPDWKVRRAAIEHISDKNVLSTALINESVRDVQIAAIKKIADGRDFADIARHHHNWKVRLEVVKFISDDDVLADILKNESESFIRFIAVLRTDDEDILDEVSKNDSDSDVRRIAFQKVHKGYNLTDTAIYDSNPSVRIFACKMIEDDDDLIYVARNASDNAIRSEAVAKIHDEDILNDIFRNDCDYYVSEKALEKINDADILYGMILQNYGYLSTGSYSDFKRNYDKLIYESIGTDVYENILDKLSDESVFSDLLKEKLFGDFRVLTVRKLSSEDTLRNLALNDLDYRVRLEALRNHNLTDKETFSRILQTDYNDAVRFEALRQCDDENLLKNSLHDLNPLMKLYASERLKTDFTLNKIKDEWEDIGIISPDSIEDEKMLYAILNNSPSQSYRRKAFDKITDEHILADIVCHNNQFRNMALGKIKDKSILLNIALYCNNQSIKRKAVKKISDGKFLFEAVQNNPYNDIASYIIDRIRDESLLKIIALNNSNPYNRKAAVNKIENQDILTSLGEIECEEVVCAAIVRKTHDNRLLEYIGLSNPSKTVRRYVASVVDDEELLYNMALKEYHYDNRRDIISKLTNEEHIFNLLKREDYYRVFDADFKIANTDLLIDLAKNSIIYSAREYALKNIKDKSIILDFIYSSPFSSKKPLDNTVWEDIRYTLDDVRLCMSVMSNQDFNDMEVIEEFLIENDLWMCRELFELLEKLTVMSSIYRVALNCKSKDVRNRLMEKLKYRTEDMDYDNLSPEGRLAILYGLFG